MEWKFDNYCVICGSPRIQWHHVFMGTANRRVSDRHGYVIPLCVEHHTEIHRNREMSLYWMRKAQTHYEHNKGTREDFIREFGRSWL